jgi:hypothetical protein
MHASTLQIQQQQPIATIHGAPVNYITQPTYVAALHFVEFWLQV